jgi:hypothetical protein
VSIRDAAERQPLANLQVRGIGEMAPEAQLPCEFRFPMPMNIANQSGRRTSHWGVIHNAKNKYWGHLDFLAKAGQLPTPPDAPWEKVTVHSVMRLGHAMDDDNAMRRHKWVMDWLKTRKYIVDDKRKHLRWAALPDQIVGRKQDYTITLTVSEGK